MKIAVLGASGGCGRWAVRVAHARGHEVTAVVREGARFDEPAYASRVVRGDPLDEGLLAEVLRGQDAVACCLGIRRDGKRPAAPLLSPPDLTSRAARSLVRAMGRCGVWRVAAISAAGVGESIGQVSWPVRLVIRSGNLGVAYRDLHEMEQTFAGSGLDWLAVRPVTLVDGPFTYLAGRVARYWPWSRVARAEVAAFMVVSLEQSEPYKGHRVLVGRPPLAPVPESRQKDAGGAGVVTTLNGI